MVAAVYSLATGQQLALQCLLTSCCWCCVLLLLLLQVGCLPHHLAPADIPSGLLLKFFQRKNQYQQQQQRRRALNLLLLPLEGLPATPQSGEAAADTSKDAISLAAAFQLSDLLLCPDEECQEQLAQEVKEGGTWGKVRRGQE
jgi:hypothetical protein